MTPVSVPEVLARLDGALDAAALGAAMELGLLWRLAEAPGEPVTIARELAIPLRRCELWLRCVERSGFIEATPAGYVPTPLARETVLATWSQATWAFLAMEARERQPALADFPRRLRNLLPDPAETSYVTLMAGDPDRARRFTRMLCELHGPLAEDVADALEMGGARRVLDLGGGSGVVAMALARRHPRLEIVVLDIPTVCEAGRAIVAEHGLAERIRHEPLDLGHDPLPAGADLALECDVGLYDIDLFRRVRDALRPGGRFVIIDDLPAAGDPEPHLSWATAAALRDPTATRDTRERVIALLVEAGFAVAPPQALPRRPGADPAPQELAVLEGRR